MRLLYSPGGSSSRRLSQTEQQQLEQLEQHQPEDYTGNSMESGNVSQAPASSGRVRFEDQLQDEDDNQDYEDISPSGASYRQRRDPDSISRASSTISTGTKMSYRTMPQPFIHEGSSYSTQTHPGPIDIVLGQRNFRITARPGSILSISSFNHSSTDTPAPPYEANGPGTESSATLTQEMVEDDSDRVRDDSIPEPAVPLQPKPRRPQRSPLVTHTKPDDTEEPISRSPSPPSPPISPATRSANAISAHYTTVVRTIDTNHRAEIERLNSAHAVELAQTRNSIDAVYRAELRVVRQKGAADIDKLSAQVQELEDVLKSTLASLEIERKARNEEFEHKLENVRSELVAEKDEAVRKAKNQVEDVWEGRWRDRMRLAGEEVGLAFGERERVGAFWEDEVKRRWPKDIEDVKACVKTRLKSDRARERRRSSSGGGSEKR